MKKIIINISEGYDKRVLRVFSANSQVSVKQPDGNWFVLKKGCVQCGKCCMDFRKHPFMHNEKGHCPYLLIYEDKTECSLYGYRPFGCCCDNPTGIPEYCSIEYEEIE